MITNSVTVTLPNRRLDLIETAKALSDRDFQRTVWLERKPYEGIEYQDDLDEALNLLFEDTDLAEDPVRYIGAILRNEAEAELVSRLSAKLKAVFDKYGSGRDDEYYMNVPEWPEMMGDAKKLLDLLTLQ